VRFLADESCDFRVVKALRAAGHDVAAILEECRGAPDQKVLARSRDDQRVLLTEDKDFGQLVMAAGLGKQEGLLLIRCSEEARAELPAAITALVAASAERLQGAVVVWTPTRIRFGLSFKSNPRPYMEVQDRPRPSLRRVESRHGRETSYPCLGR
jgi:predicted nuclease of predicted toxin-antitoxin system